MFARLVRPRLSVRGLMALVATCGVFTAAGVHVWREYFSPTDRWLRTIGDDNAGGLRFEVADRAIQGKDRAVSREMAVTALIAALGHPSWNVRADAATVLGRGGPWANRAIPALIGALNDPDETVRRAVAFSLGQIANYRLGPGTIHADDGDRARAARALLGALGDGKPVVRQFAAGSLGRIVGPEDYDRRAVIEELRATLGDPDPGAALAAAWSLANLGEAEATFATLSDFLDGGRGRGEDRVDAINVLRVVARRDNGGRDFARAALAKGLRDPDRDVRLAAALVLAELGQGRDALPAVAEALRDRDSNDNHLYFVIHILMRIGIGDPGAVALLREAEGHEKEHVRRSATSILSGSVGPLPPVPDD